MGLTVKIQELIASLNNVMGVIDGKLRNKADKAEIYTRTQLDDPLKTLGANAATASRLKVTRVISLGGEATGSVGFDGSGNVTLMVTVPGLADKANKAETLTPQEVDARIEAVIGAAPEALDTLKEIAAALGNDPNFAATMTTELEKKANSADVYNRQQAEATFLAKGAKAADSALLGGNAPGHFATAAGLSSLEEGVSDAFSQLAQSFNDAANRINSTTGA